MIKPKHIKLLKIANKKLTYSTNSRYRQDYKVYYGHLTPMELKLLISVGWELHIGVWKKEEGKLQLEWQLKGIKTGNCRAWQTYLATNKEHLLRKVY